MNKAILKLNIDGKVYSSDSFTLPVTHPKYAKAREEIERFLLTQIEQERKWRNKELSDTDWMLVSDATYAGKPLVGSPELTDIKLYRQALRDYNLTTDTRPEKPDWFN